MSTAAPAHGKVAPQPGHRLLVHTVTTTTTTTTTTAATTTTTALHTSSSGVPRPHHGTIIHQRCLRLLRLRLYLWRAVMHTVTHTATTATAHTGTPGHAVATRGCAGTRPHAAASPAGGTAPPPPRRHATIK